MALTSTLYTGLSGLDVNQTRLNVVGNNIANANTTAFKASRALFKPEFYVTDESGTPSSTSFGGTNPSQRGLGAQVAAIQKDFTPGSIETTGRSTDLALDGNGFFTVKTSSGTEYTRDGSFNLNDNSQLVTTGGGFVQGFGVDANGSIVQGATTNITIPIGKRVVAKESTKAAMSGNLDAGGAIATGATILDSGQSFSDVSGGSPAAPTSASSLVNLRDATAGTPLFNVGDVLTLTGTRGTASVPTQTLSVTASTTIQNLQDFVNQGLGINTSYATDTPPPGAALKTTGTSAQFQIIGNLGTDNAVTAKLSNGTGVDPLTFSPDAASNPNGGSIATGFTAYDSLGNPVNVDVTAVMQSKSNTGTTWRFYASSPDSTSGGEVVGTGTLNFDTNGALRSSTGTTISVSRAGIGAGTPVNLTLDFSNVTSLHTALGSNLVGKPDGNAAGKLTTFSIGEDGTITGQYDNGLTQTLGQVAVASFDNPQGLVDKGGNMFESGPSSGNATVGMATAGGNGAIRAGALEASNVDLSKEFVNLIVASTGFSAASRVISTSDQLLTQLLNSR